MALGFELDSSDIRRTALEHAWLTGNAAATPPMRLIQGDDQDPGFVVYMPIYAHGAHPVEADRKRLLTGFASAVFTVDDLLSPCVSDLPREGLAVTVTDSATPDSRMYQFPIVGSSALARAGGIGLAECGRPVVDRATSPHGAIRCRAPHAAF